MNHRPFSPSRFAMILLASTCMAAQALPPPGSAIEDATSVQLRATYLECDRVSSGARVDEDFMTTCQRVADALRDRDFGGDFNRLLQWWRVAREASRTKPASRYVPAGGED